MNSSTQTFDDFKRRRRAKWASYIIGGVIFQIFIILVFLYVLLRVRSIKLYLNSIEFENFRTDNGSSSPSFGLLLHIQATIKNSNFGRYKYQNSTVVLAYRGTHIGEAGFESGWAKARSMKKINVTVAVSRKSWTGIISDNGGLGTIPLTASAQVTGKVHILKIVRRQKLASMNCTMDVDTKTQLSQLRGVKKRTGSKSRSIPFSNTATTARALPACHKCPTKSNKSIHNLRCN